MPTLRLSHKISLKVLSGKKPTIFLFIFPAIHIETISCLLYSLVTEWKEHWARFKMWECVGYNKIEESLHFFSLRYFLIYFFPPASTPSKGQKPTIWHKGNFSETVHLLQALFLCYYFLILTLYNASFCTLTFSFNLYVAINITSYAWIGVCPSALEWARRGEVHQRNMATMSYKNRR